MKIGFLSDENQAEGLHDRTSLSNKSLGIYCFNSRVINLGLQFREAPSTFTILWLQLTLLGIQFRLQSFLLGDLQVSIQVLISCLSINDHDVLGGSAAVVCGRSSIRNVDPSVGRLWSSCGMVGRTQVTVSCKAAH